MAHPVARTTAPNGRARLNVYLPAALRDQLAREAFERGSAVSALLEEGARLVLAGAKGSAFDAPRANWIDMGGTGWAAGGVACPADPDGAQLRVTSTQGRWRWQVQAADAVLEGPEALRSSTAAMLEAEAAAPELTAEQAAALATSAVRRRRRG